MKATASTSQTVSDPVSRYARLGLWALPIFVLLLNVGNITHQPSPRTRFGDWSLYVTTTEFLLSHLFATIGGQVFAVFGAMALGVVFMQRGSVRLGLWGLLTGVTGNVLFAAAQAGIAAFVQPAIGRFYLAGHHDLAKALFDDIGANNTAATVVPILGVALIVTSFVIFGVAVARSADLPKIAGIGLATSMVLFMVLLLAFDNWLASVAVALLLVFSVWVVVALNRSEGLPVTPARPSVAGAVGR